MVHRATPAGRPGLAALHHPGHPLTVDPVHDRLAMSASTGVDAGLGDRQRQPKHAADVVGDVPGDLVLRGPHTLDTDPPAHAVASVAHSGRHPGLPAYGWAR